jgi:hypothetical protein
MIRKLARQRHRVLPTKISVALESAAASAESLPWLPLKAAAQRGDQFLRLLHPFAMRAERPRHCRIVGMAQPRADDTARHS